MTYTVCCYTLLHFRKAIQQVHEEPDYSEKAKYYGQLFRDNLVPPLERGVYYTEYVMRHKGAAHLKAAHRHLNWFQYHLFDVMSVILIVLLVVLVTVVQLIKCICRCCCGCCGSKSKQQKLKKQ